MSAKLINKKDIVRTEIHRDILSKECLLSLRQHEASCHVQSNSFLLDIVRAINKYLDKATKLGFSKAPSGCQTTAYCTNSKYITILLYKRYKSEYSLRPSSKQTPPIGRKFIGGVSIVLYVM
jgi:hypothetical protein